MAYVSQERKAEIAPVVKAICKRYNVQGSLSVHHHSTLVLTIKAGAIDFIGSSYRVLLTKPYYDRRDAKPETHIDVNPYHYREHFDGKALAFLEEVITAMNKGNHDNSDIQTDYFDVGWYISVKVGRWDKPYAYNKPARLDRTAVTC